jgi:hypothetical protein
MDILLGTKDVVVPGPGNLGCKVFLNRAIGDGSFVDSTANYNTMAASSLDYNFSHIFDADNDGDYDVLWEIRDGEPNSNPLLMVNNGSNVFTDQRPTRMAGANTPSLRSNRYFVFDFNKDGLLDVFVPGTPTSSAQLFRNNSSSGNKYINIDDKDTANFKIMCQQFYNNFYDQTLYSESLLKVIRPIELNKGGCFIATAAMGDYNHPLVIDLRLFRDNWLLKRDWGTNFTAWYYKHGPKAASVIERSLLLRKITFYLVVKPLQYITKNLR